MAIMPQITPSMLMQTMNASPAAANPAPAAANRVAEFATTLDRSSAELAGRNTVNTGAITTPHALDAAVGQDGDAILGGLERLRSVFNTQQANIANLMNGSALDTNTMLAMQMEMTNYSMLIDMTSKLASKSAQALDTLMKGQ